MSAQTPQDPTDQDPTEVVVFWRPGCPFCNRLLRWIDRNGLPTTRRDIWTDAAAAAELRELTGGDETVPTVTIAGQALINPSPRGLEAAVLEHAAELLPAAASDDGDEAGRGILGRLRRG